MAWNQASLFLVARGWRSVIRTVPNARTSTGRPLRIVRSERDGTLQRHVVRVEAVEAWLKERGLRLHEVPPRYACWKGEDVEAFVEAADGEVTGIYVRFTLSRESPARWSIWQSFVVDLCETWNLSLVDVEQATKVGPAEMFRLLRQSMAWRQFEGQFGWPSAEEMAATFGSR